MKRLDRYLFVQLLGPFGFFTLALAGILWLAQTLPLVEIIIDNGRSGFIFLEFSTLILPNVLVIVLPIAAFVATLFSVNRMFSETEMVVVMSAGLSPIRMARATIVFGTFVMVMMYVVIIWLQPLATTRLGNEIEQLKKDAIHSVLKEKQFIHPMDGITIYISDSSKTGEILGMFLHDQRNENEHVTYSADQALLLQDSQELRLVMSRGVMQSYNVEDQTLNTVEFDQFVFDLTELISQSAQRKRMPIEFSISELLDPDEIIANGGHRTFGTYFAEGHNKIALPLLGLCLPLLAVAMLLSAKYRRSGFGWRITITALMGVLCLAVTMISKSWVIRDPDVYLVAYIAPVITTIISVAILMYFSRVRKIRQGVEP